MEQYEKICPRCGLAFSSRHPVHLRCFAVRARGVLLVVGALLLGVTFLTSYAIRALATASPAGNTLQETSTSQPEATESSSSPPGADVAPEGTPEGEVVSAVDLELGDCFNQQPSDTEEEEIVGGVYLVSCDQPHENEIFHVIDYAADREAPFPGEADVKAFAREECLDGFEAFVGLPYEESVFTVTYFRPTEQSWDDNDREVACFLHEEGETLLGTMRDSER